jgi:outer membrane receptor protein involved in Fe transport
MRGDFRRLALVCTALTGFGAASSAAAAADAAAGPATVDEVVVTAQKKSERIVDVPMAVSSVSSTDLTQQNLVKLSDYITRLPSVVYEQPGTEARANAVAIRGISASGGSAATVAITVDDVPFTSASQMAQSPLPDLDPATLASVEVLRGPQGTLYGASSLGGLIKYVTAQPDPNHFGGRIEVGGNTVNEGDEGYSVRGSVNIPIIEDRLAVRVSAFDRRDPGFVDNVFPTNTGEDINSTKASGWRVGGFARLSDNFTIDLSAMRQHQRGYSPVIPVCASCTAPFSGQPSYDPIFGELTTSVGPSTRETTFELYTGRAHWDLGPVNLTSITAWGDFESQSDIDQTRVFGFVLPFYGLNPSNATVPLINFDETKKFTQEVRLASSGRHFVDWLAGAYYSHEDITVRQAFTVVDAGGAQVGVPIDQISNGTFVEKAIFGDLTFNVTDKFDVQVGGRYSKSDTESTFVANVDAPVQPIFGPNQSGVNPSLEDSSTTWLISPRYHFTPDMMVYARVATGYRPGGTNTTIPGIPLTYDPDTVTNYELGFKGLLPQYNLTFDMDVFQIDWNKMQLTATDAFTQISYFTNAGKARSRGFEVTGDWRPLHGLDVQANASWTDAVLIEDIPQPAGASTVIGLAGDRIPGVAKFQSNVSVQQDFDIGHGFSGFVGGSWVYIGSRMGEFSDIVPPNPSAFGDRLELPSQSFVDLRAGVYNDDWTLNLYVRNVGDSRAIAYASTRGGTTTPTAIYIQPRTIGFTLARSF